MGKDKPLQHSVIFGCYSSFEIQIKQIKHLEIIFFFSFDTKVMKMTYLGFFILQLYKQIICNQIHYKNCNCPFFHPVQE